MSTARHIARRAHRKLSAGARQRSSVFIRARSCSGRKWNVPGRRNNGEVFLANIWFSTYRTRSGPRLAAVVVDVSEDLRNREESSLQQFMAGSRIVVASVCHEIRNLCGAIGVVNANLGRNAALAASEDYHALATLVSGLERIASLELRQTAVEAVDGIDVLALLDELHIVIEPPLRDSGIELRWNLPASLPLVWADRHTLLQVFLNLTKNSARAMESSETKILTIAAALEADRVLVRVEDTGTGVAGAGAAVSAVSAGRRIDRPRPLCFARAGAWIPRRPDACPARGGLLFYNFVDGCRRSGRSNQDMQNIRLLLLDDHTLFRESLSRLLDAEPDFEMVADCSSIEQAIEILSTRTVDLVLLDYDLGPQRAPDFLDRSARAAARRRGY